MTELPSNYTNLRAAVLRWMARMEDLEREYREFSKSPIDRAARDLEEEQFSKWFVEQECLDEHQQGCAWHTWKARNGARTFMAGKSSGYLDSLMALREELERSEP